MAFAAVVETVCTRSLELGDDLLDAPEREAKRVAVGHSVFARKAAATTSPVRVAVDGLADSLEWHRSARAAPKVDGRATDRALLMQTRDNNQEIEEYAAGQELRRPLEQLAAGDWGENVYASGDGFGAHSVCVGDVLEFRRAGAGVVLRVQVTSPRCPCAAVDNKHGQTYTRDGLRAHTARTGLAGVFLRVLQEGDVQAGDQIFLLERPHPKWSLDKVSYFLYGHDVAVMRYAQRGILTSEWMGTRAELRELAALEPLGLTNYKEELYQMCGKRGIGKYRGQPGSWTAAWGCRSDAERRMLLSCATLALAALAALAALVAAGGLAVHVP